MLDGRQVLGCLLQGFMLAAGIGYMSLDTLVLTRPFTLFLFILVFTLIDRILQVTPIANKLKTAHRDSLRHIIQINRRNLILRLDLRTGIGKLQLNAGVLVHRG